MNLFNYNKLESNLKHHAKKLLSKLNMINGNNKGMGVIEIVLIILVLVGLVIIFRNQITNIINSVFSKVTRQINSF